MSTSLLFYSNYCQNCKKIMKEVNKSEISPKIKYICIDSPNIRNKLPQYINSVPSLVVGTTNQIYVGNQILGWIKMQPLIKTVPSQHAPPSVTQQSMNQNQTKQNKHVFCLKTRKSKTRENNKMKSELQTGRQLRKWFIKSCHLFWALLKEYALMVRSGAKGRE